MNDKYRALVWEQSRLAGVVSVWCLGLGVSFIAWLWLAQQLRWIFMHDAQELGALATVIGSAAAALIFTLRFDAAGHLTFGFDARLFRLPIKIGPCTTIILVFRALGVLVVALGSVISCNALLGGNIGIWPVVGVVALYLTTQALSWSKDSVPSIKYLLPALLVAVVLFLLGGGGRAIAESQWTETIKSFDIAPLIWALALIVSLAAAYAGVRWSRHGVRRGPAPLVELIDRLADLRRGKAKRFRSPFQAQLWYERRRFGWFVPATVLVATALLFGVLLVVKKAQRPALGSHDALAFLGLLSFLGFIVAALIAGPVSGATAFRRRWETSSSRYPLLRPLATAALARAKMAMLFDSLLLGFALVLAIAIPALLLGYAPVVELVTAAFSDQELTLDELVFMLGRPLILLWALGWVALWFSLRLPLAWLLTAVVTVVAYLVLFQRFPLQREFFIGGLLVVEAVVFPIAGVTWLSLSALRSGVLKVRHLAALFALWTLLTAAFMGAECAHGFTVGRLCAGAAIVGWVVAPLVELPMAVHRQRHN